MMPEQTVTKPVETDGHAIGSKAVKRRGLLAAAWAAVAGVVLTETTQPVEAAAFPVQWSNDPNETVANAVSSPVQLSVGPNLGNSPYGNVLLTVDAVSGAPPPSVPAEFARVPSSVSGCSPGARTVLQSMARPRAAPAPWPAPGARTNPSWRVVAKRKDICGERLAKITMPSEPVFPPPPSVRERSEPRLG